MTAPKGKTVRGKLPNRHTFRFKVETGEVIEAPAKVVAGAKHVELVLNEQHILKSLKDDGQGNTQKCAMAVCSKDHREAFGHDFIYVDWLDSKAFFVTETKNGLPSKCIAYSHHDNVAKLFDTKAGLKRLLAEIRENGPKVIRLHPPKVWPVKQAKDAERRGSSRDGSRAKTISAKKGASLRFARLQLGGVAA